MWLESVKDNRNMPFLKKGMSVLMDGKKGIIKGGNVSGNLQILFEGTKKPVNCHPQWNISYFNLDGSLIEAFSK